MTGKALSALLATLKRAGVVEYKTDSLHIRLDAAVVPSEPPAKGKDKTEPDVPDSDPEPRDWRFALEELSQLRANANKGKLGTGRQ